MKDSLPNWRQFLALVVSAGAYCLLGYCVPRAAFLELLLLFGLLFLSYCYLNKTDLNVKFGLAASVIFRLLLLFSLPALSDDYFRFLWDGRLFAHGFNPFQNLPDFYAQNNFLQIPGLNKTLYISLNSPHYFSVYPPVCQYIFWLAAKVAPHNNLFGVMEMRSFILLAEMGSFWLLYKLLNAFGKPVRNLLWYALNPLVIMELTGNVHFEALMIFFTLAAFYLLTRKAYHFSAVALGFAVCSKLLPLIILPYLYRRLGMKKFIIYGSLTSLTCLLLFMPFLDAALISNIGNSLNLYFQKFEFNASIYYVLRWLGIYFTGYNQIAKIGATLSGLSLVLILLLAWREKKETVKNLPQNFLLALTIYYLLATIVHPWYLTTLVALSSLSGSRYALIWSGLAILSYAAYSTPQYTENPWLLTLEYTGLFAAILLEKRYAFGLKKYVPSEDGIEK